MLIKWYKMREEAKIPTKRKEDAGFDIYTTEKEVVLMPLETHLFATGLGAVADPGYWLFARDRGSTGSKGIHTQCGIIDNGYRGEIFICICNNNPYPVKFTNQIDKIIKKKDEFLFDNDGNEYVGDVLYYPVSKAIAQIIPIYQPTVESYEISEDEWNINLNTERGEGKLGDSGK